MSDQNLDFEAETFLALSVKDRVQLCRRLAERAQELADAADPNYRASYLEIARNWLELADEMQRIASMEREKAASQR